MTTRLQGESSAAELHGRIQHLFGYGVPVQGGLFGSAPRAVWNRAIRPRG